ncbi:MAG: hypothetical protein R6W70_07830 [bacterium]
MKKIIIDKEQSLENVEFQPDNMLFLPGKEAREAWDYFPPEIENNYVSNHFPPFLAVHGNFSEASENIEGKNEVELLFLFTMKQKSPSGFYALINKNKKNIRTQYYQYLLIALMFFSDSELRKQIIEDLKKIPENEKVHETLFIDTVFGDSMPEPEELSTPEEQTMLFLSALKKRKKEPVKAFESLMKLLGKAENMEFIYTMIKVLFLTSNDFSVVHLDRFIEKIVRRNPEVEKTELYLIKFLYCYRNNLFDEMEDAVSDLAESTSSLYILNGILPVLFKMGKWHLVGKYYNLAAEETSGSERKKNLCMLADIYENKLNMLESAVEIHMSIVENDPSGSPVSLSKVIAALERKENWNELFRLYSRIASRMEEDDEEMASFYNYNAGHIALHHLSRPVEARELLEKSAEKKLTFETLRDLASAYLRLKNYDSYISVLEKELFLIEDPEEKTALRYKIADAFLEYKSDSLSAAEWLERIVEEEDNPLVAVRKLGRIYYNEGSWKKLVEINEKELALSPSDRDKINLLYKNGIISLTKLGDYSKAEQNFLEILKFENNHTASLVNLEKIYVKSGEYDKLAEMYNNLQQLPGISDIMKKYYLNKLGIIYRESGDTEKARRTFRSILHFDRKDGTAIENLRLLDEVADFSSFGTEDVDNQEFSDIVSVEKDNAEDRLLDHVPNTYWKYLFKCFENNKVDKETYKLNRKERYWSDMLDTSTDDSVLLDNTDKVPACILLMRRYMEERNYIGIRTLLNDYISPEPELQRKFWSAFFINFKDSSEVKEAFESLTVSGIGTDDFSIILPILEKIYLEESDFKTILFLRKVYIKKISNPEKKRSVYDETIELLEGYIPDKEIHELYEERFSSFPEDFDFFKNYMEFLRSRNMENKITLLYEKRWGITGDLETGKTIVNRYLIYGEKKKAYSWIENVLASHPKDKWLLKKYADLTAELFGHKKAAEEFTMRLNSPDFKDMSGFLKDTLLKLYKNGGMSEKAVEIFNEMSFENNEKHFEKMIEMSEFFLENGEKEKAIAVISEAKPENKQQAKKKTGILLSMNGEIREEDLSMISSVKEIDGLLHTYRSSPSLEKILRYFSRKDDKRAKILLFDYLMESGENKKASDIAKKFPDNSRTRIEMESRLMAENGDPDSEYKLLSRRFLSDVWRTDQYVLERLEKTTDSRILKFMFRNMRYFLFPEHNSPSDREWRHTIPLEDQTLKKIVDFDEGDERMLEFASILAGRKGSFRKKLKPLDPSKHHEIIVMTDQLKISTGDEDIYLYYYPAYSGICRIINKNMPALALGEKSVKVSLKETAFEILRHHYLIKSGICDGNGKEALGKTASMLEDVLKKTGKEKVVAIKECRPGKQGRALELHNELSGIDYNFASFERKLYLASMLYSFSLVPDPSILAKLGSSRTDIEMFLKTLMNKNEKRR